MYSGNLPSTPLTPVIAFHKIWILLAIVALPREQRRLDRSPCADGSSANNLRPVGYEFRPRPGEVNTFLPKFGSKNTGSL